MKKLLFLLTLIITLSGNASAAPAPFPGFIFSPYTFFYDYTPVSNQFMTELTNGYAYPDVSHPQTVLSAMASSQANTNLNAMTLAFATGTCGSEIWGTSSYSSTSVGAEVLSTWPAAGKYYIVSTGGAAAPFRCTSGATLLTMVNKFYNSTYMLGVDFDIETPQTGTPLTQTDVNNLVQSAQYINQYYPNLRMSFTVGYSSATGSLSNYGTYAVYVMNALATYPIMNYTINLMVMDWTASGSETIYTCVLGSTAPSICNNGLANPASCQNIVTNTKCAMGLSAIRAVENFHATYNVPYPNIELTPMIGGNDSYAEVFTLDDIDIISQYALSRHLGGLHYWAFSRDRDCAPNTTDGTASNTCNNLNTAGILGFSNRFLTNLFPTPPTIPTIGSGRTNPGGLAFTTTTCPSATQNNPYVGCTLQASGGTPPYTFGVATTTPASSPAIPPLPEGMILNPTTGLISSPVVGGMGLYIPTLQVTDSATPNNYATQNITFNVTSNTAWMANVFPSNSIFHHRVDAAGCGSYCPVDTSPAAQLQCMYVNDGVWNSTTSYPQGVFVAWGQPTVDYVALTSISSGQASPTTNANWSAITAWNSTATYTAGKMVTYGTYNYETAYYLAASSVPANQTPPTGVFPTPPVSNSYWTYQAASNANCALVGSRINPNFGYTYAGTIPDGAPAISVPWNTPYLPLIHVVSGYPATGVNSGPIPTYTPIEFTSYSNGDRHLIVYQQAGGPYSTPTLYEIYFASYVGNAWDMAGMGIWTNITTSNTLAPNGSANASSTSVASQLAFPEEVIGTGTPTSPNGTIHHPMRTTMLTYLPYYVWPASGTTTSGTGTCYNSSTPISVLSQISQSSPPTSCSAGTYGAGGPYGEIYRLKNSVYTAITGSPSTFGNGCFATSPQATIIMTGLANYGMMLGDGGYDGQVTGVPDVRWVDTDLKCLEQLTLSDFEPVNTSALFVTSGSGLTGH
jgi:hypothetical protein